MKNRFLLLLLFAYTTAYGQNAFKRGNLVVLKAGNASGLSGGQAIKMVEITKSGTEVQAVDVPSSGTDRVVLASSSVATIEGFLNLSNDGNYITFTGYDAEVGTSNLENTSVFVKRALGKFDANGVFETAKVQLTGGVNSLIRSAVYVNEGRTWVIGQADYLQHINISKTTPTTNNTWSATNALNNNVNINSFETNLYFTSASTTANGLYKISTDNNRFPIDEGSAQPEKMNLPGLGANPNGFVFFDVSGDAIPDLLYVADEALGLQKYYFDGTSWSAKGVFPVPSSSVDKHLRGLTGEEANGTFVIYGNTNSSILSFTDSSAPSANMAITTNLLATAETNYLFRGISFTPGTARSAPRPEDYALRVKNNTELIKTINSNSTTRLYPGMEETRITYTDNSNREMALFILTVDLANPNIRLEASLPNNGTNFGLQTVKAQIPYKNNVDLDWRVVGAVNGDYWDVSTPGVQAGTPLGMVRIKGTEIKAMESGYYFLGVLKNGTAVMGTIGTYASVSSEVDYGLGGRFYLVRRRDEFLPSGTQDIYKQPRTIAVMLSSTKLAFIAVDGRETGYSVGMTLTEIAKFCRAIGAVHAINLDGGGSTTMVTRQPDGSYATINEPSQTPDRSVATSWQILGRSTSLPIKLTSFTAKSENGRAVRLNWTTLSEINNDRFEIYRSSINKFGLPFAIVKGAGNSKSLLHYTVLDKSPAEGTNYYLLKQVDYNNKSSDSKVVAVTFGLEKEKSTVFYNDNVLYLNTYCILQGEASVSIFSTSGNKLHTQQYLLNKGQNNLSLNFNKPKGTYILQLVKNGKTEAIKFLN